MKHTIEEVASNIAMSEYFHEYECSFEEFLNTERLTDGNILWDVHEFRHLKAIKEDVSTLRDSIIEGYNLLLKNSGMSHYSIKRVKQSETVAYSEKTITKTRYLLYVNNELVGSYVSRKEAQKALERLRKDV